VFLGLIRYSFWGSEKQKEVKILEFGESNLNFLKGKRLFNKGCYVKNYCTLLIVFLSLSGKKCELSLTKRKKNLKNFEKTQQLEKKSDITENGSN